MLPECCVIDDVYKPLPADSDSTLTKRRSFGDQYLLFSRQDTTDYMENNFPTAREPVRDMIVVQVSAKCSTVECALPSTQSHRLTKSNTIKLISARPAYRRQTHAQGPRSTPSKQITVNLSKLCR